MAADTVGLKRIAYEIRKDIVRMTHAAQSGHPGGSLSAIDILTCLFFAQMRHDPERPSWEERDRFVLSKGHASPALYGILSRVGYLPHEELLSFRKFGSRLQGHPERKWLPGVEISTGSLGQGLSAAHGMALGLRLQGRNSRVYCMVGDGELQEGQVWEAMMAAGHRRPANLCVFLDHNRLQIDGIVEEIKREEPVVGKADAFGWNAFSIDGHDFGAILGALDRARECTDRATFIVAETVKGKGVSFMENNVDFHGRAPNDSELEKAIEELDRALAAMGGG
jgi:transketolase